MDRRKKHETQFHPERLDALFVHGNKGPESKPIHKGSHFLPAPKDDDEVRRPARGVPPDLNVQSQEGQDGSHDLTKDDHTRASPCPPWDYLFNVELGQGRRFVVAQNRSTTPGHFLIQKLTLPQLRRVDKIKHENFVKAEHTFAFGEHYLVAWPFMPMSLLEVAQNRLLDDIKLASILGQVTATAPPRIIAKSNRPRFSTAFAICTAKVFSTAD